MALAKHLRASLAVGLPLTCGFLALLGVSPAPAPVFAATTFQQAPPDDHPEMPNAPGKAITLQTCTKCHSISNVTGQHKSKDAWSETIMKMVGYGAVGSDDDFAAILAYVSKYYGDTPPPAGEASNGTSARPQSTTAHWISEPVLHAGS